MHHITNFGVKHEMDNSNSCHVLFALPPQNFTFILHWFFFVFHCDNVTSMAFATFPYVSLASCFHMLLHYLLCMFKMLLDLFITKLIIENIICFIFHNVYCCSQGMLDVVNKCTFKLKSKCVFTNYNLIWLNVIFPDTFNENYFLCMFCECKKSLNIFWI